MPIEPECLSSIKVLCSVYIVVKELGSRFLCIKIDSMLHWGEPSQSMRAANRNIIKS